MNSEHVVHLQRMANESWRGSPELAALIAAIVALSTQQTESDGGFTAADMSDASAQGFRAGVESVQQKVSDMLLRGAADKIALALDELDSVTADDLQAGAIGCAENALRQALAWLYAHQSAAVDEMGELVGLLDEVRSHFTRDDDLPDGLLPRIDAALAAQQGGE